MIVLDLILNIGLNVGRFDQIIRQCTSLTELLLLEQYNLQSNLVDEAFIRYHGNGSLLGSLFLIPG